MNFFKKFLQEKHAEQLIEPSEHAVIVTMDLSDNSRGSEEEMNIIHEFTDQLDQALNKAGTGEFDGDEFGNGEVTLYMYGENADKVLETVMPLLEKSPIKPLRITQRYGKASDANATEKHSRLV